MPLHLRPRPEDLLIINPVPPYLPNMQYPATLTESRAKAALTDEYARAIADLKATIRSLGDDAIAKVVDQETKDEDCRSIQTILTHIVRSGYGYAIAVRRWKGEDLDYRIRKQLPSAAAYCAAPDDVMSCNEQTLSGLPRSTARMLRRKR